MAPGIDGNSSRREDIDEIAVCPFCKDGMMVRPQPGRSDLCLSCGGTGMTLRYIRCVCGRQVNLTCEVLPGLYCCGRLTCGQKLAAKSVKVATVKVEPLPVEPVKGVIVNETVDDDDDYVRYQEYWGH